MYSEFLCQRELLECWTRPFKAMGYGVEFFGGARKEIDGYICQAQYRMDPNDVSFPIAEEYVWAGKLHHSKLNEDAFIGWECSPNRDQFKYLVGTKSPFACKVMMASGGHSPSLLGKPVDPYPRFGSVFLLPSDSAIRMEQLSELGSLDRQLSFSTRTDDVNPCWTTRLSALGVRALVSSGLGIDPSDCQLRRWIGYDFCRRTFPYLRGRSCASRLRDQFREWIEERGGDLISLEETDL